jgi:NTP-dependent ternary system trypsin peptidase co-occuring protein
VSEAEVLVQVVADRPEVGREIGWGAPNIAEKLDLRLGDIRRALVSGATAVADSLPGLPGASGWELGEVSASFGVTLTAEAGVLISTASAGATFEVTITLRRKAAAVGDDRPDPE